MKQTESIEVNTFLIQIFSKQHHPFIRWWVQQQKLHVKFNVKKVCRSPKNFFHCFTRRVDEEFCIKHSFELEFHVFRHALIAQLGRLPIKFRGFEKS
ncbi:CLUMA_CG005649, isoform A [Clunio marinus]|uniref:CLUMA_CG005649, isoform A n=1 Tax=Clunio marinus TaxID=568069 RepID=A0A1J1HVM4_9DIPT|nr:CLUMA_CG005649, isoform A [Clunio marinus]